MFFVLIQPSVNVQQKNLFKCTKLFKKKPLEKTK